MCTAITLKAANGDMLMARTMDFSYPLSPRIIPFPAGSEWHSRTGHSHRRLRYFFQGVGQNEDDKGQSVLIADGVNEKGLGAAALYFPGYAQYDDESCPIGETIAAFEVVPFLLGICADVNEALAAIHSVRIVGIPDAVTGIAAPLHWILADASGACVTIEKTVCGLRCYPNPIGVLTNSPDFGWHMTNLQNYVTLQPTQPEETVWNHIALTPFGQGSGTYGLPGDYTPPSRFVRAAWLKEHTVLGADYAQSLAHCRCILGNVSLSKGCVVTQRGTYDYTQYIVYLHLTEPQCLLKKYEEF